jgi:acyl-coenzyme A synthetase/AMP-(fatty) acid ligase
MIFETIKDQAYISGSKPAIICKDKQYTYSELIESVEKLAAVLSTAVRPGESILFASEKDYHYARMILACDILGITFIPTKPNLSIEEFDWIVTGSNPDHIIMSEADALALTPHDKGLIYTTKPDAIYTVMFTNGSTLESKPVAHTSVGCLLVCLNSIILHSMIEKDVVLSQSPIDDLYLYTLPALMKGCTIVMEQFNPDLCEKHKPTLGNVTSDMLSELPDLKDMSYWKELSIDNSIISEEIIDTLFSKGVPVVRNLYGHTETHIPSFTFLINQNTKHKLQLECNEQYEYKLDRYNKLWIKSPVLMAKYANIEPEFDNEGYWCTGDVFERKHNKLFYKPTI